MVGVAGAGGLQSCWTNLAMSTPGQFDQSLLPPHEQVIDLGGFGLLRRNFVDHHEMLFGVEPENDPLSARALALMQNLPG